MRHLDLFSGIGGFALASQWCWGDEYINVGHSEIEEFPCKVYHKHFPESKCLGDITKIEWQEGQADLITGGFPCQPHSIAGKRKGSKDERDLWGECFRALCRVRPKYALFENVSGLLTSESGRFFNRILADLASIRYNVEWQTIPACSIGAPHTRERMWITAYSEKVNDGYTYKKRWTPFKFRNSDWRIDWRNREILIKSAVLRKNDGLPNKLDRNMSLGNAIVPQVALILLDRIKYLDSLTNQKGTLMP